MSRNAIFHKFQSLDDRLNYLRSKSRSQPNTMSNTTPTTEPQGSKIRRNIAHIESPSPERLPTPDLNTAIDKATLLEAFDKLGNMFHHIPFAVSGIAALSYYGCEFYTVDHISIVCPAETCRAAQCWAKAQSLPRINDDPNTFGVKMADGRTCCIRIRSTNEIISPETTLLVSNTQTSLVTLPSIANRIAKAYVLALTNPASTDRQVVFKRDLEWILHRMLRLSDPKQSFTAINPPRWIRNRNFWVPFSASFPDMTPIFANAGLVFSNDNDIESGGGKSLTSETPLRKLRRRMTLRILPQDYTNCASCEKSPAGIYSPL